MPPHARPYFEPVRHHPAQSCPAHIGVSVGESQHPGCSTVRHGEGDHGARGAGNERGENITPPVTKAGLAPLSSYTDHSSSQVRFSCGERAKLG
eukprot:3932596-Rhodomonas_salina.1